MNHIKFSKLLKDNWQLNIQDLELIPHGFFRMSYKVTLDTGTKYFLKVYEPKSHVVSSEELIKKIRHAVNLSERFDFIPKFKLNNDGGYYVISEDKILILQDYLDITNKEDIEYKRSLPLISKIHNAEIELEKDIVEDFKLALTERRYENTKKIIKGLIEEEVLFHKDYLHLIDERFELYLKLRKEVNKKDLVYVHKDPFGNVVETEDGLFMIDWDDIAISNPEADTWVLFEDRGLIREYEEQSGREVRIQESQYYALENFFLYYDAYAKKYFQGKNKDKREVIEGIKDGIMDWFEGVYERIL